MDSQTLFIIENLNRTSNCQDINVGIFCAQFNVLVITNVYQITLLGLEAHGGYTFCGFAALALLGQEQKADIKRLLVCLIYILSLQI